VEVSIHRGLGIEQRVGPALVARAELYDRALTRVRPRFVNQAGGIETFPEAEDDRLRLDPVSGRSRGLELMLQHAAVSRLALASLSLLGYTYVGYPALVAALARTFGGEHPKDAGFEPRVSVLIPVYNAKSYVKKKLESLVQQDYPKDKLEILVYSDAATDGSDEEVLAFADRGVTLVRGEKRPMLVGMRGTAKVVVGRRSLISFAFEPIRQLRENMRT
jgi:hypothetical protein